MGRRIPTRIVALVGGHALVAATLALGAAPAAAASGNPEPPANLRVTQLDHTSATVRWDPTGWADNYTVIWTPGPPPAWVGWLTTGDTVATFAITSPGAQHRVTVLAQRGSTYRSSTITFRAPDEPPPPTPPTPENVAADVSPGSVTVTWDPSVVDGDEADVYVVKWRADDPGISLTSGTSITRTLTAGAELEITVTARNGDRQDSEPSDPVPVTVPPAEEWEDLGPPTGLTVVSDGDGDVTRVEWNPPTGGVDPITYRLNYRFADSEFEAWIAENDEPFIDVPAQIGELIVCPPDHNPGQTWVIWVTAESQGETSPRSEETTICLPW